MVGLGDGYFDKVYVVCGYGYCYYSSIFVVFNGFISVEVVRNEGGYMFYE